MNDLDAVMLFGAIDYLRQTSAIEQFVRSEGMSKDDIEKLADRLYESGVRIYE